MNILDQLEARILQLLDNMSLMQMEIDELTDKNQYLQSKIAQADELEAEVTKIRAEQAFWHERLQKLLGKIDDVAAVEDVSHTTSTALNSQSAGNNLGNMDSVDRMERGSPNIDTNALSKLEESSEDKDPFFDINQNFTPEEKGSDYQTHRSQE